MASKRCEHGRASVLCRVCRALGIGGGSLCEHDRVRSKCKTCKELGIGGGSICEHGHRRSTCKECKALGIGGNDLCEHNRVRARCALCKGSGICVHGRIKESCKSCKGSSYCVHGRRSQYCTLCKPEAVYNSYVRDEKRSYGNNGLLPENFMTLEEFLEIISNKCWFCNLTPEQANGMGVDRIDNSKGHVSGNMEACCRVCNQMRMDLPREIFLQYCREIVKTHSNTNLKETVESVGRI